MVIIMKQLTQSKSSNILWCNKLCTITVVFVLFFNVTGRYQHALLQWTTDAAIEHTQNNSSMPSTKFMNNSAMQHWYYYNIPTITHTYLSPKQCKNSWILLMDCCCHSNDNMCNIEPKQKYLMACELLLSILSIKISNWEVCYINI